MAKILVVDDDHLVRRVLRSVLKLNRHEVIEASDGMEALDSIDPDALPDLIFMDIRMPRLNGIECAKQIIAQYPSLKIIMMTGSFSIKNDGHLDLHKYLFTDILLKPFTIKDVTRAVEYALGVPSPRIVPRQPEEGGRSRVLNYHPR